jgi:rhomboid protease GluP
MRTIPATIALAAVNAIVFFSMLAQQPGDWTARFLFEWGGNLGRFTLNGEEWRLLTAIFLHGGFMHIAGNLLCLLVWGSITETMLGTVRFVLTYFACGLLASLASASLNPNVVSVGASGAIAGLLGSMVVMWLKGDARISAQNIFSNIALNVVISLHPSVDWVGHLAGFGAGLGLATVLFPASFVQKSLPEQPDAVPETAALGRPTIPVSFQEPMDFPRGSVVYRARDRLVAVLPDFTLVADHPAGALLFATAVDYRDTMNDRDQWPLVREFR